MDYRHWLQIIEIIFWIAIILSCIVALFRGRVFAIKFIFPLIFFNIIMMISYIQEFSNNSEVDKGYLYSQSIFTILLAIITIYFIFNFKRHYLIIGIGENKLFEVITNIIVYNNWEYEVKEGKVINIKESPDDDIQYAGLAIMEMGTSLNIKNNKKGKADQLNIFTKIMESLRGCSLSSSSKILLLAMIIFSCLLLYTAFRLTA